MSDNFDEEEAARRRAPSNEPFDEQDAAVPGSEPVVERQDYLPPTGLDYDPDAARRRQQIVAASVVAALIAVFAIVGLTRIFSNGRGTAPTAFASANPNGAQPAGNIVPTPYPTATRAGQPFIFGGNPTQNPQQQQDAQARLQQQQLEQQQRLQQQQLQRQQLQQQQDAEQLRAQQAALQNGQGGAQPQQVPAIGSGAQAAGGASPGGAATVAQQGGGNSDEMTIAAPPQEQQRGMQPFVSSSTSPYGNGPNGAQQYTNAQTINSGANNAFIQQQGQQSGVGYQVPQSIGELLPTTFIDARLYSAINSDLPGPAAAQVTQPVYDSATHSKIVIPAGAKLFGTYDSAVISGQNRLLIAWTEIIFPPPDGRDFRMGAQPGTDAEGRSGFSGHVDKHLGEVFRTAFLATVLGVGEGLLVPQNQSVLQQQSLTQIAAQNAGAQLSQVTNKIIDQQTNRAPTITIEPPYEFEVFVVKPLPLETFQVAGR